VFVFVDEACGVRKTHPSRCCGVFVDESAEAIVSMDALGESGADKA